MKKSMITALAAFLMGILFLNSFVTGAEAKACWVGQIAETANCPPPPAIEGKVVSTAKFNQECGWLPFPVGVVAQPVVFFTKESDARCLGRKWKRECQDCTDWIHGKRGPINGPAAEAVIALRLVNNLSGISIPRSEMARIKKDAGWCDFGRSAPADSHYFNERPW